MGADFCSTYSIILTTSSTAKSMWLAHAFFRYSTFLSTGSGTVYYETPIARPILHHESIDQLTNGIALSVKVIPSLGSSSFSQGDLSAILILMRMFVPVFAPDWYVISKHTTPDLALPHNIRQQIWSLNTEFCSVLSTISLGSGSVGRHLKSYPGRLYHLDHTHYKNTMEVVVTTAVGCLLDSLA